MQQPQLVSSSARYSSPESEVGLPKKRRWKTKNVPIKAGSAMLISQIQVEAAKTLSCKSPTPIICPAMKTPIKNTDTDPRTPSSDNAIVGMEVVTRYMTGINIIASPIDNGTLKARRKRKNCVEKTRYRKKLNPKTFNNSLVL